MTDWPSPDLKYWPNYYSVKNVKAIIYLESLNYFHYWKISIFHIHMQQQQPSLIPLSGVGYMDQMTP